MILEITYIIFVFITILCFKDRKYAIFFYIFFIPLSNILPKEYNVFGIVSFPNIINAIALLHLVLWDKQALPNNRFKSISLKISYLFFAYMMYVEIRNSYLGILPYIADSGLIITLIRRSLLMIPLIILIRKSDEEIFKSIIIKAFFSSLIFLSISIPLTQVLVHYGFKVYESTFEETVITKIVNGVRVKIENPLFIHHIGFLGEGDYNVLGALLNMMVGFIISYYRKTNLTKNLFALTTMIVLTIGVVLTGSRMALITNIALWMVYIFGSSIPVKTKTIIVVSSVLVFVVLYQFHAFDFIISRFQAQDTLSEVSLDNSTSRTSRWFDFIDYSTSNFSRLIFGYDSVFYATGWRDFRDPHNLYVAMLYYGGIVFPVFFIFFIFRLIKSSLIKNLKINLFYPMIPCFVSTIFISQFIWVYYLLLIISQNEIVENES